MLAETLERSGRFRTPGAAATAVFWTSLVVVAWVLGATTWVCDDAFITFRSVEQLLEGHGPRWNPHERVQAFTHPLWFAAVALVRAVVGDPVAAVTILSWTLAVATFWLLARNARASWDGVLLVLALALASRAFIDFSSSGLEDPGSHLLLAVLALVLVHEDDRPVLDRLRKIGWLTGLLLLCRHDNLWLVAPLVLWLCRQAWRTDGLRWSAILRALGPGLFPFVGWTAFSLVYYGFPFPNTAYAKLNTGIPGHELWPRGVDYLRHTAVWDPVSMVVIAAGMVLWLRRGGVGSAMALGMALHLLYVVRIGGDFMAGRFLSEPFVVALVAVSSMVSVGGRRRALPVLAAFVALWPLSPLRIDDTYSSYHFDDFDGIADERAFHSGRNSSSGFDRRWPIPLWRSRSGPQEHFEVGFSAYSSGTDRIIVDRFALADPLLARLPAAAGWKRVGHFKRNVPAGYLESLRSGRNEIANPFVRRLYDDLRMVTQAPLFGVERWAAMWRLNVAYRRPGCLEPPCRELVTHLLPQQLYSPLLPVVDRSIGGVDDVRPLPAPVGTPGDEALQAAKVWIVEGRVPFSLLQGDQLVRVFLPAHPSADSLELAPGQDPAGDLSGFRMVLTFDDPATAQQAAMSLCVAAAAEGGDWVLLPRLDSLGEVCSRLAVEE